MDDPTLVDYLLEYLRDNSREQGVAAVMALVDRVAELESALRFVRGAISPGPNARDEDDVIAHIDQVLAALPR
jgi:hypothetical protein